MMSERGSEEPTPRSMPFRAGSHPGAPAFNQLPAPDGVEALYYEGMAAYQHRHWQEALDKFTRLKELQPTRPGLDALLEEVRWFLQLQAAAPTSGALDQAGPKDGERLTKRPISSRIRTSLYLGLGILALAALLLAVFGDRLTGQGSRATDGLFERGQERLAVGDYEGARAAFEKVLEVAPDNPEAQQGLDQAMRQQKLAQGYAEAEAAYDEENWDRAGAEVAAVLAVDPNYPGARQMADNVTHQRRLASLYADGGRLYDLGRWQEALDQFELVRNIDPAYRKTTVDEFLFVCYLNAGEALLPVKGGSLDEVTKAVRYFDQALAIHPRNRTAADARRLGGFYFAALEALDRNDSVKARGELSMLVAESPAYAGGIAASLLYDLIVAAGDAALAAGDVQGALEHFGGAQVLPVNDTRAAQQGIARARAATPTPSPTPPATATFTPVPTPWAVLPAGPMTVRSGPGSNFGISGELAQGASVAITGRLADGAWLRVCCTAEGSAGWVAAASLEVAGPLEQAEVVTLPPTATATRPAPTATRPPQPSPTSELHVCVQGSVLNVAGGQGIAGWTVKIVDAAGSERTASADAAGFYQLVNLTAGPATLTVDVPAGWRSVSPLPATLVVDPAASCAMVDFWAQETGEESGSGAKPTATPFR